MRFKFDIQFFGGGGGSARQYRKRDPEDPRLGDLRNILLDKIMPGLETYDPTAWQRASETSQKAQEQQLALLERMPGMLDQQAAMLGQIPGMMDRASPMLDQMQGLIGRIPASLDKSDSILDEMMGVVRSGEVPAAFTDRMNQSVTKDLQSGMGSMLNNLASRGVINSSITSQGTSRLAQQAADAYNKNYLNAYNSVLGGYAQGLQGAQGNTANLIGGIGAIGSGVGAIGNAANVYANAANAAGSGANALSNAIGAVGNIPSQAYEGVSAALMPAYNMWKTWQTLYNNSEDYDTVVKQGK